MIRRIRRALHVHHATDERPVGTFLYHRCRCGQHRITWTRQGHRIWESTWVETLQEAHLQVRLASKTIRLQTR